MIIVVASVFGTLKLAGLIIVAVIALGVVVFAHEWGHFIAGRRVGIRAEAFSIGFGPILWRRTVGETEYRLSAILFGGYVKFAGMEGTKDKTPQQIEGGFYAVSPARRILAAFTGPLMNALLAFALFFVLWGTGRYVPQSMTTTVIGAVEQGAPAEQAGLRPGDRILTISGHEVHRWSDVAMGVALGEKTLDVAVEREGEVQHFTVHPKEVPRFGARTMGVIAAQDVLVYRIVRGSEAERMGLRKGDRLLRLNGERILSGGAGWQEKLLQCAGQQIEIAVERDGKEVSLTGMMPAAPPKSEDSNGDRPQLGVYMSPVHVRIYEDPLEATAYCFSTVGRTLEALLTRRVKASGLAGPVGIVGVITVSLSISFTAFLWWGAFISLNLAVVNLLPIPVVDGGHILFSVIEAVRRKPVREKTMAIITNVFAALIIAFFVYITFNDVRRFFPAAEEEKKAPPAEEAAPKAPEPEPAPPELP